MEGYIENISNLPKYIFKSHVLPGGRLSLEEIYSLYVSFKEEDSSLEGFKEWLNNYISDKTVWKVVFKEKKVREPVEVKTKPAKPVKAMISGLGIKKEYSEEDIVKFTIKEAKKELPKIKDKRLLKRALKIASSRPRKEKLCRLLYDRIDELP